MTWDDLDEMARFDVVHFDEGGIKGDHVGVLKGWHQLMQVLNMELIPINIPNAVGSPSHMIAHFGLALQPFLLT